MRRTFVAPALLWLSLIGLAHGADPARPGAKPKKPPHDKLPVTMHWDLKSIQALGTIVTTTYDAKNERIIWVLETKKFVDPGRIAPMFWDDEGSPLLTGHDLKFRKLPPDPNARKSEKDKMERVEVILTLPGDDILKETFRVVLQKFD
jgi:hypothetical protein